MKVSEFCVCPVVHPKDIVVTRCMGAERKHTVCGGVIPKDKRTISDDRPEIEKR